MKLFANFAITTAVKLLVVAVAMMLLTQGISAQSALTADAFTDNSTKTLNSNFGNNPNLTVSSAGNVYVKFKLSSTVPAGTPGADVARATLKLYVGNIVTPGRLDIYKVNSAWDEATITSANAPPLGSLLTTTQLIDTDMKSKFLVVDVTSAVRQWLGDGGLGANGLNGDYAVGDGPRALAFDGANIWVANVNSNNVMKLRASDGANLGTFATALTV